MAWGYAQSKPPATCGISSLGHLDGSLGCPVAAELPSLLLIPVAATFPQRGEAASQGQGGLGLGLGLAEQGVGRCRRDWAR